MDDKLSIKRRKASDNELSFDSLRSEAIKLLQKISGETWTDYNLHDPGITILEQILYALTDLIYRSGFGVQDYLAGADGDIDFEALNLVAPHEILSCRPTTTGDYCRLMLNKFPEVDNVWFMDKAGTDDFRGLYRLLVKLEQGRDGAFQKEAREQLFAAFHAARNLCEDLDLADIEVVKNIEFELCASIEVNNALQPEKLLAEIYFRCARRMASNVSIKTYDQVDREKPLDQLFDGPFTSHGFFDIGESQKPGSEFLVATLFATINEIPDVNHVQDLYLRKDGKNFYVKIDAGDSEHDSEDSMHATDLGAQAFDLKIPRADSGVKVEVELTRNGRKVPISLAQMEAYFDEFRFKEYSTRSIAQDLSLLKKSLKPEFGDFEQYFSIQNQFPPVYGVNQQGVPASAKTEVKARARQLKGYLVVFEQLMVNFLANIDALKTLFSTRGERSTYAVGILDEQQIADLSAVYPENPGQVFRNIMARFDNANERKSRLLDYLLAIYGESFTQNSLRHFNYYYGKDEIEGVIVNNKISYLESIVDLGRDRAAAPDYCAIENNNRQGGLSARAAMLLGFKHPQAPSLRAAMKKHGFDNLLSGSGDLRPLSSEEDKSGFGQLFSPPLSQEPVSIDRLRASIADIISLDSKSLSELLLINGIYIDRYRIGRDSSGRERLFLIDSDERWWRLGDFSAQADSPEKKPSAIEAANSMRQMLLAINRDSEGLYIVEHLLLRPHSSAISTSRKVRDFYSFTISVIFPSWTARCSNSDFQSLARETLELNAPAHVMPEFCWLDFTDMQEFEKLFDEWWNLKNSRDGARADFDRDPELVAKLDEKGGELKDFLIAHHEKRQTHAMNSTYE